jgi:hypothetical protein
LFRRNHQIKALLENGKHEILNYILKEFSMAENGTPQANYGTNGGNDKHCILLS